MGLRKILGAVRGVPLGLPAKAISGAGVGVVQVALGVLTRDRAGSDTSLVGLRLSVVREQRRSNERVDILCWDSELL